MDAFAPSPVAQFDAQQLGRQFATRRRQIGWVLVLAGVGLIIAGFAGFGVYGNRVTALQKNGIHATATITDTALFRGGGASFREHIDVAFRTPSGEVRGVRIAIGDESYDVGQKVEISYDPADPYRAVFAHGYSDIGPMGAVFFFGIVAGVGVLVFAVRALRLARGARHALDGPAQTMSVESRTLPRDRFLRTALLLDDGGGGEPIRLWATAGSGWLASRVGQATVFGTGGRGSVAVVVDPHSGTVTAARFWKPRHLRRFGRVT